MDSSFSKLQNFRSQHLMVDSVYIYTYVFCFKYDVHVVWPMWVANVQNVCFMWGVWNAMQQGDNRNLLAKRHGK